MAIEAKQLFIYFVRFIKVVVVVTLLLLGAAQGMMAKSSVQSLTLTNQGKAFAVMANIGYMCFIVILIIAEFGFRWFEKLLYGLHFWLGRGLFLGWLGIQGINQGEQIVTVMSGAQTTISPDTMHQMDLAVGWTLISIGILYIVMTFMCLQRLVGIDSMEEVDRGFSGQGGSADEGTASLSAPLASSSKGELDGDDLQLLQNAAAALGLTVRELRNRFSGKNGSRDAERYHTEQASKLAELARLSQQPSQGQSSQSASKHSNSTLAPQQSLSVAQVSVTIAPDDDSDGRRRSNDDDLEAQYYAAQARGVN